ncbi:DNRLRE domain-containing protein [Exiguobacterium sp. s133]|uniref:DNRLRE domain-containing protein n=1 Tax=Exiguobacterium sp. s133 TaxID=2751213 RepID=UPI001BEC96CD|nr:DNRLRE domain-containing protein [Exiguobacterium sp. s133]
MRKISFQKWSRSLIASSLLVSSIPVHLKNVHAEEDKQQLPKQEALESSKNYNLDLEEKIGETMTTPFMETKKKEEGNYQLTVYNDENFLERKGTWDDVDMHLIEKEKSTIEPKNTKIDVKFDRIISSKDSFMEINDPGSKNAISFQFEGIQTKDGLQKIEKRAAETINNRIIYKNVYPNLDVRHIVMNEEVKEDIILNEPNEEIERFIYQIDTDLDARLDDEGNIIFKDSAENGIEFTMPAPVMSDSSFDSHSGLSKESRDIRYELTKESDGYRLALIPNKTWLEDKGLQYPVYIDPTITNGTAQDAFVTSADPKGNYQKFWSSAQGEYVLRVGKYDSQTGTNYAFMKMKGLTDLKGATIASANLKTYVKWSYHPSTKTGLWLDKVNSSWSDSTINWDNKPTSTNITSTTAAREQWATFNVKKTIQQIADGSINDYGFKLHANGNDQNYWKQITASESAKKSNIVISYSYPQMKGLKAEPYPTAAGSSTGYINLSWAKANEAIGYRLQLFNGKGWRTIYKGTSTSFSTKNKKIWPTTVQFKEKDSLTGGIAFREGDGMELPLDPSPMYRTSSDSNTTSKAYQFRVVADYELGSGEVSTVAKPVLDGIIPENPESPQLEDVQSNDNDPKGWFELEWDETEGATSYDLMIYNGTKYERIPVGNVTNWSSKGKRLFPTEEQLNSSSSEGTFRQKGDGRDFLSDPRSMYSSTGIKHEETTNYFVKLIAKSDKGESLPSPSLKIWFPTKSPSISGRGFAYKDEMSERGYLTAAWNKIEDAAGYLILIDNGVTKQIVQQIASDTTYWSSLDSGLFPSSPTENNFQVEYDGLEFLRDAGKLYSRVAASRNDESSYRVYVQAYRSEDYTQEELTLSRYLGKSDIESEESSTSLDMNDYENEPIEIESSIKKMNAPIVEIIDRGIDEEHDYLSSDLSVSWAEVPRALKYQVMLYNGHDYTYFDVPGDITSWTTMGKKIYPTTEQMANGEFSFRTREDGVELPSSPETLYNKVQKHFNEALVNKDTGYQIKITAILQDGSSVPSDETKLSIPLEEPQVWIENDLIDENGNREIELGWHKAQNTTSELLIFNGRSYETYNMSEETTWNSNQAQIYSEVGGKSSLVDVSAGSALPESLDKIYLANGVLKTEIDALPAYRFIVRTKDSIGRASETEVEINRPWVEDVSEAVDDFGSGTIEDDFSVNTVDGELILGNKLELEQFSGQRAGAAKALVRAITTLLKKEKKVKLSKKRTGKRSLTASIKFDKKNAGGKVAKSEAIRYMSNKNLQLGKKSLDQPVVLTPERFEHIIRRHHTGVWDGSFGKYSQTFFPNGTSYSQITDLISKSVKHPNVKSKLMSQRKKLRVGGRIVGDVEINGAYYRIGFTKHFDGKMHIDQFYPKHQLWRF